MNRIKGLKTATVVITILILTTLSTLVYAISTGITGRTRKGPNPGCTCHSPNPSSGVTVTITGPDSVVTGQTANYTVSFTGGPLVRGGTNIAVKNGAINPGTGSGLQKISNELTHTTPKLPSSGSVSFAFTYTAPASAGLDTLYATGNSVDFSGTSSGDVWNFANNKGIIVTNPIGIKPISEIASSFSLSQNYPNPFNPNTVIEFVVKEKSDVKLVIFDNLGKVVETLVNEQLSSGSYKIDWNASNYPSGVYYYKILSGNFTDTKKMLLIK